LAKIRCTSCRQEIPLGEGYVKFECPFCEETIYRCEKCRTFGHPYKCKCGFEGP